PPAAGLGRAIGGLPMRRDARRRDSRIVFQQAGDHRMQHRRQCRRHHRDRALLHQVMGEAAALQDLRTLERAPRRRQRKRAAPQQRRRTRRVEVLAGDGGHPNQIGGIGRQFTQPALDQHLHRRRPRQRLARQEVALVQPRLLQRLQDEQRMTAGVGREAGTEPTIGEARQLQGRQQFVHFRRRERLQLQRHRPPRVDEPTVEEAAQRAFMRRPCGEPEAQAGRLAACAQPAQHFKGGQIGELKIVQHQRLQRGGRRLGGHRLFQNALHRHPQSRFVAGDGRRAAQLGQQTGELAARHVLRFDGGQAQHGAQQACQQAVGREHVARPRAFEHDTGQV
ncbi:MAG: hypothetical protein ACRDL7_16275, partial [Gaiellaceae bacterium]